MENIFFRNNKINNLNYIFLLTIPIFLIINHNVADFLIVIMGLIFLYLILLKKNTFKINAIFKDKIILFFIIFWILLVLSSVASDFKANSFTRSITYIRFVIFLVVCKYWLLVNQKRIIFILYILAGCSLFVALDIVYQFFNTKEVLINGNFFFVGTDIFGYKSIPWGPRLQGPFGDSLIAGTYLRPFSIFFIVFFLNKLKKKNSIYNIIFIFCVVFFNFVILITGDRSPYFMFILSIFILCIILREYWVKIFISILCCVIFTTIFLYENPSYKKRYVADTFEALNFVRLNQEISIIKNNEKNNFDDNKINKFSSNYKDYLDFGYGHLYYSAIKIFLDKPFFGVGTKNYRLVCFQDKYNFPSKKGHELCSTHPHNFYLELLSETGLFGFFSFFSIFFIFFKKNLKFIISYIGKNFIFFRSLLLINIVNLWPFVATGSIVTNRSSIYFWFSFALLISFTAVLKKSFINIRLESKKI
jgi:hypothetical protein